MKPPARLSLALCAALFLSAWPHSAAYAVGKAAAGRAHGAPTGAAFVGVPALGATLPMGLTRVDIPGGSVAIPGAASATNPAAAPISGALAGPLARPAGALGVAVPGPEQTPESPQEPDQSAAPAPAPAPKPERSAEQQQADAQRVFDGAKNASASATAAPEAPAAFTAGRNLFRSWTSRLARPRLFKAKDKASETPAPGADDQYGGPPALKGTFKDRVLYGAKWGVTLVGLNTALALTLKPLLAALPWQFLFSPETIGRVELLARMGPNQIAQALGNDAFQFLFWTVPIGAFFEELSYRGIGFGLWFLALSLVRPAALGLSRFVDKAGDGVGWKPLIQFGLGVVSKLTDRAFTIAAAITALGFALSHVPAWGFNPFYLVVHGTMGVALAYVAYRTRGLTAPTVAHAVYNMLSLLVPALAIGLGLATSAAVASMLIGAGSLAFLVHHWLSHRKETRARLGQAPRRRWGRWLGGSAALLLALGLFGLQPGLKPELIGRDANQAAVTQLVNGQAAAQPPAKPAAVHPAAAEEPELELIDIVKKAKPAVVKINTGQGMGSGFIVSKEGLLITNHHVVEAAGLGGTVVVQLNDGTMGPAMVIAMNADKDIAFVQLPAREGGWPFVPLGDSDELEEGQEVIAMGYPLDLPFTVTRGIVSGLEGGRGNLYVDHLQTDAAINHGNSGGPLFDRWGRVIGMNSQIASTGPEGGSIGIGFSVVSNEIKSSILQFVASGNIASAYMGILIDGTNPAMGQLGVLVERVRPGSPAAAAGLKDGDLILSIDGRFLPAGAKGVEALHQLLAGAVPGQSFAVGIAREGQIGPLALTLGPKP